MRIDDLIKELQDLHPEIKEKMDAKLWMQRRQYTESQILDFLSLGKALRVILPLVGKPYFNTLVDGYRKLSWRIGKEVPQVLTELERNGLNIRIMWGYLEIHTLPEYYPSSFYTSDDPEVWKMRQARREASVEKTNKIREVSSKLDRE